MKNIQNITRLLKRTVLTLALLGIASTFFGCHTAHGVGEDVQSVGRSIQEHTP